MMNMKPMMIILTPIMKLPRVVVFFVADVLDEVGPDSLPFDPTFLDEGFINLPISQQIQNEEFKREYKDFFYPHVDAGSDPDVVAPPVIKTEEPSVVDINYVMQGDTLKIHIPSNTKQLLIEKDGSIVSVDILSFNSEPVTTDQSSVDPPSLEDRSNRKRNRVPFLPLEREYIMSCYKNLVDSGIMSKIACARMIWNEIYSNVSQDGDSEIINAIRRPLRSLNKPDIKKDRSMKSILNLIYNRTTKRHN